MPKIHDTREKALERIVMAFIEEAGQETIMNRLIYLEMTCTELIQEKETRSLRA